LAQAKTHAHTTAEKYEVYAVRQFPSEVLGEAYAVVTATRISRKDWLATYFLLTQWPAETPQQGSLVVSVGAWKLVQRGAVQECVLDAERRTPPGRAGAAKMGC
jgi:hypothetical protein